MTTPTRADRFVHDLKTLKIPDPATQRATLWLRTGIALMIIGLGAGIVAFFISHNASDPRDQTDDLIIAIAGLTAALTGSALFLRYSITNFLRYWLARQSLDLNTLADRLENKP